MTSVAPTRDDRSAAATDSACTRAPARADRAAAAHHATRATRAAAAAGSARTRASTRTASDGCGDREGGGR